jgi:hypothetical protein
LHGYGARGIRPRDRIDFVPGLFRKWDLVLPLLATLGLATSGLAPAGRLHVSLPALPGVLAVRLPVDVATGYGWPLRPFDKQHVIRSGFGEPRFGAEQRNFHFGIDLPAASWTPVYAVAGGTAFLEPDHVAVLSRSGPAADGFSYWHIVPAVSEYAPVRPHQLLGWVKPIWGHLHFAEIVDGRWVNPLRLGLLRPYHETHRPRIWQVAVVPLPDGHVNVIVDTSVEPARRPAPPWQLARLAPSLVRWRLLFAGAAVSAWQNEVDFRVFIPPNNLFADVYAAGTRPNRPGAAGRYRFYLARDWDLGELPAGSYALEVQAIGSRGATATAYAPLHVHG